MFRPGLHATLHARVKSESHCLWCQLQAEFEAGFERGGQTREHAQLAKTLGVAKLIVAVRLPPFSNDTNHVVCYFEHSSSDHALCWQPARLVSLEQGGLIGSPQAPSGCL